MSDDVARRTKFDSTGFSKKTSHTHTGTHSRAGACSSRLGDEGVVGEGNRHTIMADGKINLKSSRNQRRQLVIEVGVVLVASEKDRKRVSVQ